MTHPYSTLQYAQSLFHCGRPFYIPEWNTWILIRTIQPGMEDGIGTYPIAILDNNIDVAGGLERLRNLGLVSLVLILDDYHRPTLEILEKNFTIVKPFKTHYIFDRDHKDIHYDSHCRYELRKANKEVHVAAIDLQNEMKQWLKLYNHLITFRKLDDSHIFPLEYHQALASLDGITAIGAWKGSELVSCHIWASDGISAHSHLAASSPEGYACRAAYAINDASLRHFLEERIINFGGSAGITDNTNVGLARFKRNFSNKTSLSYLCGAILNKTCYADLCHQNKIIEPVNFFPAYRSGS